MAAAGPQAVKRHLAHCAVQSLMKTGENCVVEVGGHLARRGKGRCRQDLCVEETFNIPAMRCRSEGHLAEMRRRTQTKRGWAVGQGSCGPADSGRERGGGKVGTPGS